MTDELSSRWNELKAAPHSLRFFTISEEELLDTNPIVVSRQITGSRCPSLDFIGIDVR